MKHQSTKDFSTVSTSGVENYVENVETVENSKNHVENPTKIPFIVYEATMARMERHIKRLWIALIIAISLVFASNAVWLSFISQYNFESYDLSTEGGGNANYIGNDGEIYNGTSKSTQNCQEEWQSQRQIDEEA